MAKYGYGADVLAAALANAKPGETIGIDPDQFDSLRTLDAARAQGAAVNPPHYKQHPSGVECIQITEHMNFNLGNVVKYVWRADEKGDPMENLLKAQWYLNREIERRGRK